MTQKRRHPFPVISTIVCSHWQPSSCCVPAAPVRREPPNLLLGLLSQFLTENVCHDLRHRQKLSHEGGHRWRLLARLSAAAAHGLWSVLLTLKDQRYVH